MKKLLNKFFFLLILLLPYIVKADMGAPILRQYEVVVTNEEGIDTYTYSGGYQKDGHLDKDTKITIDYEETSGSETYLHYEDGYVLASDVRVLNEEVKPTDDGVVKLEKAGQYKVSTSQGVSVRKGPSKVYDEITTLPEGTEGKYQYVIEFGTYIYIEKDDIKGWIDISNANVYVKNNTKYVTATEIKLSCTTIPPSTQIDNPWQTDDWTKKVLLEYNNCNELYTLNKMGPLVSLNSKATIVYATKEIKLYNRVGGKVISTIPIDGKIKSLSYLYLDDSQVDSDDAKTYLYVEYNKQKGWIENEYDSLSDKKSTDDEEEPTTELIDDSTTEESEEEKQKNKEAREALEEESKLKEQNKKDSRNVVLICVIVGVAVALAAITTIVLINKKKKNKQPEPEQPEVLDMNEKN